MFCGSRDTTRTCFWLLFQCLRAYAAQAASPALSRPRHQMVCCSRRPGAEGENSTSASTDSLMPDREDSMARRSDPGERRRTAAAAPYHRAGRRARWPAAAATFRRAFVAQLFGRAVPEDLVRYGAGELAALARARLDFLPSASRARRKSAARPCRSPARGDRKAISVLEIVNDDMPFLVDSVLGELADRGLDVRLVVHPVFGVERDAAGRLDRLRRGRTPPARCARASSTSISSRSTTRRAAPRSCAAHRAGARRRAALRAGLAADDRARRAT